MKHLVCPTLLVLLAATTTSLGQYHGYAGVTRAYSNSYGFRGHGTGYHYSPGLGYGYVPGIGYQYGALNSYPYYYYGHNPYDYSYRYPYRYPYSSRLYDYPPLQSYRRRSEPARPRAEQKITRSFYPPASAPAPAIKERARLQVHVPANAEVWFEGYKSRQTASVRTFTTPPLSPQGTFRYTVRLRWQENGQTREKTGEIEVRAGQQRVIRLPDDLKKQGN
jgi:uncharacterized protein (TIGR03000 family)